jgi:hypothetical protein
VLFDKPQSIKRVVIHTGSREHPKDRLENARLDACLTVHIPNVNTNSKGNSGDIFKVVNNFAGGLSPFIDFSKLSKYLSTAVIVFPGNEE